MRDGGTEDIFKDHVATYWMTHELGGPVERLQWRNRNGSSNYYANYMCYLGNLVVTGDMYEAIYCVYSSEADLAFFSRCDACYLAGKLRGPSGHSDDAKVWDSGECLQRLKEHLDQQDDVSPLIKGEFLDDAKSEMSSEHEWMKFLDDNHGDATTIFGEPYYEACSLGWRRNPIIDAHVEGLRRAMQQLKDAGKAPFLDIKK